MASQLPGALSAVIGIQQPVLGVGRQIAEQAFGTPRRRLVGVEARLLQCGRPVETQIDRHRAAVGGGLCADLGERPRLELDHLRLVHLVHDGARGPLQPVSARIQARCQDHHLPDPRGRRVGEEVVEELRPDRHVVDHPVHPGVLIVIDVERGRVQFAAGKLGEYVDTDRPHQWLGVRVGDQRAIDPGHHRPSRRHHRRGRPHAGGQIPAVVVRPSHEEPLSIAIRQFT